jgi:sugar lactone lactonase YvrE
MRGSVPLIVYRDMTMRILVMLTAAASIGIGVPSASGVATPHNSCPETVRGSGTTLHPEGIAYDQGRDRFLIGSVKHGMVSVVGADGVAHTLIDDPALITTMGITVDGDRVLVVNGDIGVADRTSDATNGKTAGLGIYDRRTGKRIRYVDLGALDPSRGHFGNDVAVAADGTAYVTDSISGAVYQVGPDGHASVLVRDDRLTPVGSGNGANGIVLHPGGYLLVAQSSGKALYRIPLDHPDQISEVTVDAPIGAPDGLLLDGPGLLHAVDNTSANRVVDLKSDDDWHTATLAQGRAWADPAPTTMARGRCGIYVLTGRLDLLLSGTPSDEFLMRKID